MQLVLPSSSFGSLLLVRIRLFLLLQWPPRIRTRTTWGRLQRRKGPTRSGPGTSRCGSYWGNWVPGICCNHRLWIYMEQSKKVKLTALEIQKCEIVLVLCSTRDWELLSKTDTLLLAIWSINCIIPWTWENFLAASFGLPGPDKARNYFHIYARVEKIINACCGSILVLQREKFSRDVKSEVILVLAR